MLLGRYILHLVDSSIRNEEEVVLSASLSFIKTLLLAAVAFLN